MRDFLTALHNPEINKGYNTGFEKLDKSINGLAKGSLTVIGAGTGVGKSIFATQILINLARQKVPSLYIELENGPHITYKRLIQSWLEVDQDFFKEDNIEKSEQALKELQEYISVYFYTDLEMMKWGIMDYLNHYRHNKDVFLIDPLGALETKINATELLMEQGNLIKKLQEFCNLHRKSVMLTHHIRKGTSNAKKSSDGELLPPEMTIPTLESLRGSSNITNSAHSVWGLARNKDSEKKEAREKLYVSILKNREGLGGNYQLHFNEQTTSVTDNPTLQDFGYFKPWK